MLALGLCCHRCRRAWSTCESSLALSLSLSLSLPVRPSRLAHSLSSSPRHKGRVRPPGRSGPLSLSLFRQGYGAGFVDPPPHKSAPLTAAGARGCHALSPAKAWTPRYETMLKERRMRRNTSGLPAFFAAFFPVKRAWLKASTCINMLGTGKVSVPN